MILSWFVCWNCELRIGDDNGLQEPSKLCEACKSALDYVNGRLKEKLQ